MKLASIYPPSLLQGDTTLTFFGDGVPAVFPGDGLSLLVGDAASLLIFTGAGIFTFLAFATLQAMACWVKFHELPKNFPHGHLNLPPPGDDVVVLVTMVAACACTLPVSEPLCRGVSMMFSVDTVVLSSVSANQK